MRVSALALCAAAFATSLALAAPRVAAATPESQFRRDEPKASASEPNLPRSEPQASGELPRSEPQASGEDQSWLGRYCTPTGCAGDRSSPAAQAASFGAAVLTIAFLARRRRA